MNHKSTYLAIVCTMLLLQAQSAVADVQIPERRTDQYITQSGYVVLPLPYSVPGIGSGLTVLGSFSNVYGTTIDIDALAIGGDAGGSMLFLHEIPLAGKWLSMEAAYQNITKASINFYSKRGMEGAKNDFNIMEVGFFKSLHNALVFSFYDKRFNFRINHNRMEYRIDALRDSNGEFLNSVNIQEKNTQNSLSFQLDLTDDHFDPRRGFRLDLNYSKHKARDIKSPDLWVMDTSLFGYIPVGKYNTLALNYFQSDAHVTREGETNMTAILAELEPCTPGDTACEDARNALALTTYNERKYGTARDMGGDQRLRSYPGSRYKGAHSAYLGVEFRWNFFQEATPFDYWIWRDVRTGIQTAFFVEAASVSETTSALWREKRVSVGTGVRLITASGGVYRADVASGSEGTELTVVFNYPW
ncbi:MAG: hypothetical protein OEZ68_21725 [Gammaproteobacteria bacterium]|nr:hypothetical protein [Gammaproteobacteria bacterium]MDH5803418.1 hypothetical protein [Gammaproteobacteria bacterium]